MGQAAEGHVRAHRRRLADCEDLIGRSGKSMRSAPLTLNPSDRSSPRLHPDKKLRTGIGLRAIHHSEILTSLPQVGWFEAHSENYFAAGGALPRILGRIREHYPLSLHGVGLSIGSTDPLARGHLAELARLVRAVEPMLVSEHLSWSSV